MASPLVWGPLLWNMFSDVAYGHDQQVVSGQTANPHLLMFFYCWCFLLPCKYCRESYQVFFQTTLDDLKQAQSSGTVLQWVHQVHNLVNYKLDKSPTCSVDYDQYERRMKTWDKASSPSQWFDVLFILGLNYDETIELKRKYMLKLMYVLPAVWPFAYPDLWFSHKLTYETLTKKNYLNWLYDKYKTFMKCQSNAKSAGKLQTLEQIETRLSNAFAQK